MNSIIEVNGNEGKFTSLQPGDHIIATTIYKHGRVKKWKGIVLGDKKPKERKRRYSEDLGRTRKKTRGK